MQLLCIKFLWVITSMYQVGNKKMGYAGPINKVSPKQYPTSRSVQYKIWAIWAISVA